MNHNPLQYAHHHSTAYDNNSLMHHSVPPQERQEQRVHDSRSHGMYCPHEYYAPPPHPNHHVSHV